MEWSILEPANNQHTRFKSFDEPNTHDNNFSLVSKGETKKNAIIAQNGFILNWTSYMFKTQTNAFETQAQIGMIQR